MSPAEPVNSPILQIAFASKRIRSICEIAREAERRLGQRIALELQMRLADLDAAVTLADLPLQLTMRVHRDGNVDELVIILGTHWELAFMANHDNNPTTSRGELDFTRVEKIKITRIEKISE